MRSIRQEEPENYCQVQRLAEKIGRRHDQRKTYLQKRANQLKERVAEIKEQQRRRRLEARARFPGYHANMGRANIPAEEEKRDDDMMRIPLENPFPQHNPHILLAWGQLIAN